MCSSDLDWSSDVCSSDLPGDAVQRGQRYGFIRFGSRVDVYLPITAQPRVAPGDKVFATTTILAELHPAQSAARAMP